MKDKIISCIIIENYGYGEYICINLLSGDFIVYYQEEELKDIERKLHKKQIRLSQKYKNILKSMMEIIKEKKVDGYIVDAEIGSSIAIKEYSEWLVEKIENSMQKLKDMKIEHNKKYWSWWKKIKSYFKL